MVKAFGYGSNGGPEVQEFLDLPMPTPLAGELLVEVRSAGVNPVDWKIRSGLYSAASAADLPAVLGSEVSGVVREVGKDVDGFAVNDEVFGTVAPAIKSRISIWSGRQSSKSIRCGSPDSDTIKFVEAASPCV